MKTLLARIQRELNTAHATIDTAGDVTRRVRPDLTLYYLGTAAPASRWTAVQPITGRGRVLGTLTLRDDGIWVGA